MEYEEIQGSFSMGNVDFTVQIYMPQITKLWKSSALQSSDLHTGATQGQGKELSQYNGEERRKDKAQPATRPVRSSLRGLKLARLLVVAPPCTFFLSTAITQSALPHCPSTCHEHQVSLLSSSL